MRGRPVTPPGGLNIGQYDRQVKEQAPQKKQEYKRMLDEVSATSTSRFLIGIVNWCC